jgi:hypothetical protein
MKKSSFLLLLSIIIFISICQSQSTYKKTLESNLDMMTSYSSKTSDGGHIITGQAKESFSTYHDIFLIKTDSLGNVLWSKVYQSSANEFSCQVTTTSDGGYLVFGSTVLVNNGICMIKTDSVGNYQWSKVITSGVAGSFDRSYDVAETSDGKFLIVAASTSGTFPDPVYYDIPYILKVDANGNVEWSRKYNNGGAEGLFSGIETLDKKILMVGITSAEGRIPSALLLTELDSLGNTGFFKIFRYPQNLHGHFIYQNPDSSYLIGATIIPDLVLIKLKKDYSFEWSKTYANSCVVVRNIIATIDNGYFIITDLGIGPFLAIKINSVGDPEWSQIISDYISSGNSLGYDNAGCWQIENNMYQIIGSVVSNSTQKILFETINNNNSCETTQMLTSSTIPFPDIEDLFPESLDIITQTYSLSHVESILTIVDSTHCGSFLNIDNEKIPDISIRIYPNPAYDFVNVQWDTHEDLWIDMIDINGKKVLTYLLKPGVNTIDISTLVNGVYTIGANGTFKKILVAHC